MALKISVRGFFHRSYLKLTRDGIKFFENGMLWGAHRFRFAEISCVLMSTDNRLSFQAGSQVFSIPTNPLKMSDEAAIAALIAGVERSRLSTSSTVSYSAKS